MSTTTLPMPTTMPTTMSTTMPTQLGNESCNTPLDYSVVRKNNLDKITEYYNTLLNEYSKTYTDYASQSNSVNTNDRTYAETTLKPKTEAYNTQIINLSKELIDTVNKDTDLILDQKNELETKTQKIDTLMNSVHTLNLPSI